MRTRFQSNYGARKRSDRPINTKFQPPITFHTLQELPENIKENIATWGVDIDSVEDVGLFANLLRIKCKEVFIWKDAPPEPDVVEDVGVRRSILMVKDEKELRSYETELVIDRDPKPLFKIFNKGGGSGGYGSVSKARHKKSKAFVALKKVKHVTPKQKRSNLNEIYYLRKMQENPNIVKFYGSYLQEGLLWIVTEYLEGGTLTTVIKKGKSDLKEVHVKGIIKKILLGIDALHYYNIVHRDIKPHNIMVNVAGDVKLIDFGLCEEVSGDNLTRTVGTSYWMAPEMLRKEGYGLGVDIWAAGICLAELLNGRFYHQSYTDFQMMYKTQTLQVPEIQESNWSTESIEFSRYLLEPYKNQRPTASQALLHPFLEEDIPNKALARLFRLYFLVQNFNMTGMKM